MIAITMILMIMTTAITIIIMITMLIFIMTVMVMIVMTTILPSPARQSPNAHALANEALPSKVLPSPAEQGYGDDCHDYYSADHSARSNMQIYTYSAI